MDQWRTVLTLEIGPRTCRASLVEQQHPAHVSAVATGHPVPTGDYAAVVSYRGTYDPPELTHTTFTRTTTRPAPTAPGDVRALLDLALAVPGRHHDDAEAVAAVAICRPCPGTDAEDLLAALLPEVPVVGVDALDVLARGAVIGDVLLTLDAGTDDHGDPLVHSAVYDDLGGRLSDPRTDTADELAALVRQDTRLGCPASTGIHHVLGDAATTVAARLHGTRITEGPYAGDRITSSPPHHPDPAAAVAAAATRLSWPR
ncbi:hypothetical protein WDV85_07960 [Pseudokineococcus sp. 5B2Z-1]|uniref:hypothetical protein n=1 Tax=Pseudokineococcus sp. 5B2Z-1 TaxID=3132744 RepID=UPI0030A494D8